ncbi:LytTR family DNA-binding domain-containing protein [Clostridium sp. Marseille-Q2269]|uniref:LytR/AlgR family response regulator transcription factor n=1 Tax=Clostridium sp. Marseille-Q2269 TaxID=2942205 RepID=UPI002073AF6E|nr:LytTR family DNA-binding domain-containing protein [Clostridium sp. Marseille-Q2269]
MYNIAIYHDDKKCIDIIKKHVEEFYRKKIIENRILCFDSPDKLLEDCEKYNLILLDIDMKYCYGIEMGRRIRKKSFKIEIIYIANCSYYYPYAFQVHAFAYIIKPVKRNNLFLILNELNMHNNISEKISLKTRMGIRRFNLDKILYIESIKHELKIVCDNRKEYIIRYSMKEIYAKLKDCGFDFSHKGFIVNLKKIKYIKGFEIILENNICVPLAQKRAKIFKRNLV